MALTAWSTFHSFEAAQTFVNRECLILTSKLIFTARPQMQSAVLTDVEMSVRPSVRHISL